MNRRRGPGPLLLTLALLVAPSAVAATTISITGTPGIAGADGSDGNPGGDGVAGGDGQSLDEIADAPGQNHSVTVRGGDGGTGGNGGDGVPAGANGGNGANGGAGGDATARAIVTGGSSSGASAIGGNGGAGGEAGNATAPGVAGTAGVAGAGGDALAEATLTTDFAGDARAGAAAGQSPSAIPSPGAGATATADSTNTSTAANSRATSEASAYAAGTSDQSDASATATSNGAVAASSFVSTFNNGHGSDATSVAHSTSTGTGPANATAMSAALGAGGNGDATSTAYASGGGTAGASASAIVGPTFGFVGTGAPFDGGVPSATAEAHSTGGGPVFATATVSRRVDPSAPPIDVMLDDAVSGSTAGLLTLRQETNASFGNVINSLVATNPGGGALAFDIRAGGGSGGDTVLGDILATSTTGQAVSISVGATAPVGGSVLQENRGSGGPPTPARIHAESNGGDVLTEVQFSETDPLAGAPLEMVDVASGDTAGALTLRQTAQGYVGTGQIAPTVVGVGESVLSSLTKHTASSELELFAKATGGQSGFGSASAVGGSSGKATTRVDAANSAGTATVYGSANGGAGFEGAAGGDAELEAKASTTGDGHAVVINLGGFGVSAVGGVAYCVATCASGSPLARGGDAKSTSTGIAMGDSTVTVFDGAAGGDGGRQWMGMATDVVGGDGGDGTSSATATGAGVSTVKANADARGGSGGYRVSQLGQGGDADATASATGLGRVESWARASGGDSVFAIEPTFPVLIFAPKPPFGPAGSGTAHATADGASGFARAEAITGWGDEPKVRAQSEAQVGSVRDVAASAVRGGALASAPADPGLEGMAFVTSAPLAQDVQAALAGNSGLAALSGSEMLALSHWRGQGNAGESLALSTEIELAFGAADARALVLGAFDASVVGDGFESLAFSLFKNGTALGAPELFDSQAEVLAYFTNTVLDLGAGWATTDKLMARFDLALSGDTSFAIGLGFAAAVPEPGTAMLVALGVVVIAVRRRFSA